MNEMKVNTVLTIQCSGISASTVFFFFFTAVVKESWSWNGCRVSGFGVGTLKCYMVHRLFSSTIRKSSCDT